MLAEYLIKPKLQNRSPCNQVGQKGKKEWGQDMYPLRGNCERRKIPSPLEASSPARRSTGTEREFQRLRREWSSQFVAGRIDRDQHRGSMPPHCIPQPRCASVGACWSCVLKLELQRTNPREDCSWLFGDSLKGPECVPGGNVRSLGPPLKPHC